MVFRRGENSEKLLPNRNQTQVRLGMVPNSADCSCFFLCCYSDMGNYTELHRVFTEMLGVFCFCIKAIYGIYNFLNIVVTGPGVFGVTFNRPELENIIEPFRQVQGK